MISLIFVIIFFLLFIFFCIAGGNYLLKSIVDNVLSKNEKFTNFNNKNIDETIVNPTDDCKKIDERSEDSLNFQTATNIPLSPNYYKNYVGSIYMDNPIANNPFPPKKPSGNLSNVDWQNMEVTFEGNIKDGSYCLKKGKLLYDGIWDPKINKEAPYEYESWNLTDGDLSDGFYCSDKLIQVNKPFPKDYRDMSATPPIQGGDYYTYFNDINDDVLDTEISCFPSVFDAGITEDLKKIIPNGLEGKVMCGGF